MKKIVFLSIYFPKLPSLSNQGPWALDQVKALSESNDVCVYSFTPYIPKVLTINSKFKQWNEVYKEVKINSNLIIKYPRINPYLYKNLRSFQEKPQKICNFLEKKIIKDILKYNPDIIIANHVLLEGLIAKNIKEKYGIPYFCFEHSPDDFLPTNEIKKNLYSEVVKNSEGFINVSQYSFDLINKYYNFDSNCCKILYNYSQDSKKFKKEITYFNLNKNKKYIIQVGNFEKRKNHSLTLEMFLTISKKYNDWNLILVGGGNETIFKLRQYITTHQLSERVHIFESLQHEKVLSLLNHCEIFILPSLSEMFNVSVLEALSAGLAVISTKYNGLVDNYFYDNCVINVDPADKLLLQNTLEKLVSDDEYRKICKIKAREQYEEYFTYQKYVESINRIVQGGEINV